MTKVLLLNVFVIQLYMVLVERVCGFGSAITPLTIDWNAKVARMENAFAAVVQEMKKSNVCTRELEEEAIKITAILKHYERRVRLNQLDSERCTYECERGWAYFERTASCYTMVRGRFTFAQAREGCERRGANLTSIHSEAESDFINDLTGSQSIYWIGLEKQGDVWQWIDGTPLTYTRWREGEPDGCCGGEVDAVTANYGNDIGEWDDGPSISPWHITHHYVCKKEALYQ